MEIRYERGSLTGIVRGDPGPVGVLLAHGAGAGQHHPWIATVAEGLAEAGLFVVTFNYPYTEAGRRAPDRLSTLVAAHRAAADEVGARCDTVVLAGKSMGGRVGSHLAGDEGWPVAGLVYYGYPLLAMGSSEPRPVDHLRRITAPQLFFAGSRDRLGPPDHVEAVAASLPDAAVIVVEGGDHSFRAPKASGVSDDEILAGLIQDTAAWIDRAVTRRNRASGR